MEPTLDIIETNRARLSGEILKEPFFSHKTYGEAFYETLRGVERSRGYRDEIRLQISERLLRTADVSEGSMVEVRGQVRTYNEDVDGRSKLNIVVFVREINNARDFGQNSAEAEDDAFNQSKYQCAYDDFEYENEIYLDGHICKEPVRRTSPLGREICDIMLAVNRMYNKSDYVPCIAWGRNAAYAGTLEVGDRLTIYGRIQSREYRKRDEDGNSIPNVAYEVSVIKIED